MNLTLEIKPSIGLSQLHFGQSCNHAETIFGKPDDIEIIDDIEDATSLVWHYWEKGFSLFFDELNNREFCCAEIDNINTLLWGIKIFSLKEKEIVQLLQSKSHPLSESEMHDWGEKRLSFDTANIDLYFEKNRLVSVNFGKAPLTDKILILPN